jgi:phosphoglycerate dehydrogenase-like enzyme
MKELDIVKIHAQLTPEALHLIGKKESHLTKKSAILMNPSRIAAVDETLLVLVLKGDRTSSLRNYEEAQIISY